MFKKTTVFLLTLFLVLAVLLAGCDNGGDNDKKGRVGFEPGKPIAKEDLKIGIIYISPTDDGGYSTMHYNGVTKMADELGLDKSKNLVHVENISDEGDECRQYIINLIDDGCNVIIGTSYGYGPVMNDLADKYDDVVFIHCSGEYNNDHNMANFFGRMYQARFLSGIVAGMNTETNKIGYVAAHPIAEVVRGLNAFTLGVRAVNPEATVHVLWTNSWYEPLKEKYNASTLIAQDCDVIAQHQDSTSAQEAAEEAGKKSIGYNADMSAAAPNAHLCAPSWDWSKYYTAEIKALIDGDWKPEYKWPGIETGIVHLSEISDSAVEGTKEKVEEFKEKILNGEFKIFGGREIKDNEGNIKVTADTATLTDEQLLTMDWLVEGVVGSFD